MKSVFLSLVAMLTLVIAAPAFAADAPADGLKMENTKKPVVFNHSTHTTVDCAQCHHPVDGKEEFSKCSTTGCHDAFDRKDKTVKNYYKIFHGKGMKYTSCISCHRDVVKDMPDQKKALTGCSKSKCHP